MVCRSCDMAKKRREENASKGEHSSARLLDGSKNPYEDPRRCRDKPRHEPHSLIKAFVLCICVPQLVLFGLIVIVAVIINIIPAFLNWILE